jgi:hypothetical protein
MPDDWDELEELREATILIAANRRLISASAIVKRTEEICAPDAEDCEELEWPIDGSLLPSDKKLRTSHTKTLYKIAIVIRSRNKSPLDWDELDTPERPLEGCETDQIKSTTGTKLA